MDLRGTIVDSNSALKDFLFLDENSIIYSSTNDEKYFYIGTSNGIAKIDLNTNIVSSKSEKQTIGYGVSFELLVDEKENLYKIHGKQPIYREENIYFLSGGELYSYSTSLSTLSNYIQTTSGINCFSITRENETNIVSKNTVKDLEKNKLYQSVLTYCRKYRIKRLGVSLSGGVDSMVLLFLLQQMVLRGDLEIVVAIHVDYNWRKESNQEAVVLAVSYPRSDSRSGMA
jgi:hypothetical protein